MVKKNLFFITAIYFNTQLFKSAAEVVSVTHKIGAKIEFACNQRRAETSRVKFPARNSAWRIKDRHSVQFTCSNRVHKKSE